MLFIPKRFNNAMKNAYMNNIFINHSATMERNLNKKQKEWDF